MYGSDNHCHSRKQDLGDSFIAHHLHMMQTFISHIAWESEVWIAEDPDHMIHFNGERFLRLYADVLPNLGTNQ